MLNSNKYDRPVDEVQEALENQIRDNAFNLYLASISEQRKREFENKRLTMITDTPNPPNNFIQQYFQENHNKHLNRIIIKNVYDSVNITEESLFQLFDFLVLSRESKSDFVTFQLNRLQKEKSGVPVIVIDSFCDFEPMIPPTTFTDSNDSKQTTATVGIDTPGIFKTGDFPEPMQELELEEPVEKKAQFKQTPLERLNKKKKTIKPSKFFQKGSF